MRALVLPLALLGLVACAPAADRSIDSPQLLSRAIDHDIETTLPSADRNLRAALPGRPLPIENGEGTPRL